MKSKNLPKNWKEVEVKEICIVDSGQSAPQGEEYFQGDKTFVRANDLNSLVKDVYVGEHCKKINCSAVEDYSLKEYSKGSIVFPKSGMSVKKGNIAILKEDSYVVNHLAILEPSKNIDNRFLFFLLKKRGIHNLNQNSSYPSIRISDIRNLKISLPFTPEGKPDLEKQKKIASILEKAEELKQKRENANKLADEYLKSVFYEMFGDPESPNNKFEKKSFLETIEKEASNNDLKVKQTEFLKKGEYPVIDQGEKYIAGYTNAKKKLYNEKFPVIVFGDHTRILKFVDFPFALGADGVKILIPKENYNARYFHYCLHLLDIKSAGYSRHYKYLKNKKIPLPPLELQEKFASIVEHVEKIKEKQKKSKQDIDEMFNALMQKAFRGELVG